MARSQSAAPGPWRAWAAVALIVAVLAGAALILQGSAGGGVLPRRCPVAMCNCPSVAHLAAAAANSSASPQPQLVDAANTTLAECPSCPPLPDCPGSATEGEVAEANTTAVLQEEPRQQQQQQQQQRTRSAPPLPAAAGQAKAPLLCGGSLGVPPVADALAAAGERLRLGLQERFAQYEGGFTLEDLIHTAENLGIEGVHDTMLWVELRNGTVVFPRRHGQACTWFCNPELTKLKEGFEAGIRSGQLKVPDNLPPMLWNVYDYDGCRGPGTCTAPLLSVIRHSSHFDVLVPSLNRHFEPHFLPWDEKRDLAFFRGKPWCNPHPLNGTTLLPASNCSREALPLLSLEHPDLLNVTLLSAHGRAPATPGPPTSHAEHGQYKYLVNLDGITASSRLGTLLSINSLVLKQASLWEEWYYTALAPCVHYLPFWQRSESDIVDLLTELQRPGNQAVAQRIAANSWAFSAAHLNDAAVYRYWQAVLDKYSQLYRGAVDPKATAARLAWAEQVGRRASKLGAEVEERCWREQGAQGQCWWVGRDAAREAVEAARQAQQASDSGSGDGSGDGVADASKGSNGGSGNRTADASSGSGSSGS